jgi:hypothetical protein
MGAVAADMKAVGAVPKPCDKYSFVVPGAWKGDPAFPGLEALEGGSTLDLAKGSADGILGCLIC